MCEIVNSPAFYTIFGVVIGCVISYYFARRLLRINHKYNAGKMLVEALLDFSSWVFETQDSYSYKDESFINTFHKQYAIALEYRSLLSHKARISFDAIWEKYYYPDGQNPWSMYYSNETVYMGSKKLPTAKEEITERINAIVEFIYKQEGISATP